MRSSSVTSNAELTLFTAATIPADIVAVLVAEQPHLAQLHLPIRWTPPANFHLTLRYLGRVRGDRLDAISRALEQTVRSHSSIELHIANLGAFPSQHRPQILWAGVDGQVTSLLNLQADIEATMQSHGFDPEHRPFQPHITLGRIKKAELPQDVDPLKRYLHNRQLTSSPAWAISSVALMQSVSSPNRVRYQSLHLHMLAGEYSNDNLASLTTPNRVCRLK